MATQALAHTASRSPARRPLVTTLFDLAGALVDDGATDADVTAFLRDLLGSGRIRRISIIQRGKPQ